MMKTQERISQALLNNLQWFRNSGVADPADGRWGVAERIALTHQNEAIERTKSSFPAWTDHDGYCIIEQRRADCNFQSAYLFLLAYESSGDQNDYATAVNILDFLYFRSGLLNRDQEQFVPGSWNWSHIKRESMVWFDDEAWCIFIPLEIARRYPALDARYRMKHFALLLAGELATAFEQVFTERHTDSENHWVDPTSRWNGRIDLPHWGATAVMGLARAYADRPEPGWSDLIRRYAEYMASSLDRFIVSEQSYALIGCCAASAYLDDPFYRDLAQRCADAIRAKMDPATGNIPAEHYEAPTGKHLVDTIYTVNWALLGLQAAAGISEPIREAAAKVRDLLLDIQDRSPEKQFFGCWRGMFDLNAGNWGGGNCYEGGAGSIYTGWTNAPIATCFALELLGQTFFQPANKPLFNK